MLLKKKKSWKWPNELTLRKLQHAIFDNAQLIRWALNFSIRRSNSRVSQSIPSREKKNNSASVARMWKVESASSSLRFLSVKGYIHHHLKRISGYSAKQWTPKWEIYSFFALYLLQNTVNRTRPKSFRVTVLTDMRKDYWVSSPKCSCVNNSDKSLKLCSSFYFNYCYDYFFLLIDLYCV